MLIGIHRPQLINYFFNLLKNFERRNHRHTTMVNRAIAQHARRAGRRFGNSFGERGKWASGSGAGGTKDDDCPGSDRRGNMRRSSVIGHKQINDAQNGDDFGETGFSGY